MAAAKDGGMVDRPALSKFGLSKIQAYKASHIKPTLRESDQRPGGMAAGLNGVALA
jgi:hypothetical protein